MSCQSRPLFHRARAQSCDVRPTRSQSDIDSRHLQARSEYIHRRESSRTWESLGSLAAACKLERGKTRYDSRRRDELRFERAAAPTCSVPGTRRTATWPALTARRYYDAEEANARSTIDNVRQGGRRGYGQNVRRVKSNRDRSRIDLAALVGGGLRATREEDTVRTTRPSPKTRTGLLRCSSQTSPARGEELRGNGPASFAPASRRHMNPPRKVCVRGYQEAGRKRL